MATVYCSIVSELHFIKYSLEPIYNAKGGIITLLHPVMKIWFTKLILEAFLVLMWPPDV